MRHVAPHRWADALAGRLSVREAASIAAHADGCERCGRERDRIGAAQATFADIRNEGAPDVKWDRVRAQVYWKTSSQLRIRKLDAPRRASIAVPIAAVAAAAAIVVAVASGAVPRRRTSEPGVPVAVAPAVDTREVGVLTLVRGDATVDGHSAIEGFARTLGAMSEIRTGSGEVSVQFGDGSAFAVGPRSVLRLREFDRKAIALEIDGRIDVDVAPRAPGQRFVVIAGSRTVEVRGTGFRVERIGDAVAVRCRHGRVAVKDDGGEVEVSAGEGVEVPTRAPVKGAVVRDLAPTELSELAASVPHKLAVWAAPDAVTALTAPLSVMAPDGRGVRVDGAEVGNGPLTVRVVSGRHLVETEVDGAWVSAGWVDVRSGPIEVSAADEDPAPKKLDPPRPDPAIGRGVRRRQLHKQIDDIRPCVRSIDKQGIEDTFVEIELSIDGNGAVRFANVMDTDLPSTTARCVRDAVAAMRFPAGPAVTWRETIKP